MTCLMGIDIGTSGTKTILIDENGKVFASVTEEYPLSTPKPNWAEQDPADWWNATVTSIKKVLKISKVKAAEIKGIGLSGQMHGSVFLDKKYNVLRPCILWCDQRTEKECAWITDTIGKSRMIELTSNPALTGFTAGKVIWVRNNEPQVYEKIHKILLPKDYIRFKLTGEFATEVSDASGTSFFDVKNRKWSDEVLEKLKVDKSFMPDCYESPEVSGKISESTAKLTGLEKGTPVVGGGGDQAAQAVGTGIVGKGVISSTIGTSGVVFAYSDGPNTDPLGRLHTFCHAVPGKWHQMGVMLCAGGSLQWFRNNFCSEEMLAAKKKKIDPYQLIIDQAKNIAPGSEGLVFLPYLTGERTPYPDPNARGVFFGLSIRHKKAHLIRSILEGVSFGLTDSLEIIRELKVPINEVRASGGGARSTFWRQMQADIFGCELVTVNVSEGAAFGVALLAGVGSKVFKNVQEACDKTIKITNHLSPDKANIETYKKYYGVYRDMYALLKEEFKKLN